MVLMWGASRSPHNAFDDAYITYRYADNLRQGLGLVYNPGEWVLGITTPLFALLLGALGWLIPDLEALGHWLGVLSWIAATWAAMALLWQAGRDRAALVAGLLLAVEPSLLPSLGMETPLLVALMLATAWAWLGGRKGLAACLAAALLLTRQDSALWLLLLGLEVWRRERTLPWRVAVGTLLLTLPWFAFAGWRYGSILPNSIRAKLGQNELMPVGGQSAFWQMLGDWGTAGLHPAVVVVFAAALLLGLWIVIRFARSFWWLVVWTLGYVAIYTWLGVASFPWYFVPPLTAGTLVVALGFGYLLGDRPELVRAEGADRRRRVIPRLLPVLGGLLLAVLVFNRAAHMREISPYRGYRPAYVPAGQWLADHTPAGSSVMAIEIGVIGYYSQRPIVDTMGLVSLDMTRHQVGWAETVVYALAAYQPDYVVALPQTARDWIVDKWWFQEYYQAVAQFDEVTLYQRQDPPQALLELPFQIEYVDGLTLTGAKVRSWTPQPGIPLEVWMHVEVESPPPGRYLFSLYLMDTQTYERFGGVTAEPFDGYYGTPRWQAGDRLALPMRLEVPPDLAPGTYRLGIIVYDMEREVELPLRGEPDRPRPDVRVGWFRLGSPPPPAAGPELAEQPVRVEWQEGITLTGLGLPARPVAPGEVLPVGFTWQPSQPVSRDLTVFVHLLDAQGEIVAQLDRLPFHGRWPTPVWQPGESLRDRYDLALPATLPPGRYGVRFGFYDQAGRLLLADGGADSWLVPEAGDVAGQP